VLSDTLKKIDAENRRIFLMFNSKLENKTYASFITFNENTTGLAGALERASNYLQSSTANLNFWRNNFKQDFDFLLSSMEDLYENAKKDKPSYYTALNLR